MQTITLTFTLDEINLLNNFIQNSVPDLKFSESTAFIAKIQKQIKQQLENNQYETTKN